MYKIIGGDQNEYGPVSFEQLTQWIRDNRANSQTLIQKEGGPWVPLGSLPEFAQILGDSKTASSAAATGGPGPASAPLPGSPAPYVPPPGAGLGTGYSIGGPERAQVMVQGPATALMVTGILGAVMVLIGLVFSLIGTSFPAQPPDVPPELRQFFELAQRMQSPAVVVIDSIIKLALSGLTVFAAQKLRALENFGIVITGTILAMIPCISPCCCVGIPVGIWVLVVAFKPEVRSAFR